MVAQRVAAGHAGSLNFESFRQLGVTWHLVKLLVMVSCEAQCVSNCCVDKDLQLRKRSLAVQRLITHEDLKLGSIVASLSDCLIDVHDSAVDIQLLQEGCRVGGSIARGICRRVLLHLAVNRQEKHAEPLEYAVRKHVLIDCGLEATDLFVVAIG